MSEGLPDDEALFLALRDAVRDGAAEAAQFDVVEVPGHRVVRELSRGGQGAVYEAVEAASGRRVALKVLARRDPASRARFAREVALASELRHPGVVAVLASGVAGERPWYTMELVHGQRLDDYVRAARPSPVARRALFAALVDAVAHAHRNGVIHRDLKPANILIDRKERPRIVDFGLAVPAVGTRERVTESGEFLGTLRYCAPEQLSGAPTDTRTDVHALGVLFYELVSGASPWDDDDDAAALVQSVLHRAPRRPRVDRDTWTVLATALAKEPARRYATADALLRDVRRIGTGAPLDARRPSVVAAFLRARRRSVAVAGLCAALGLVFLALRARDAAREGRRRQEAALAQRIARELLAGGGPMSDAAARLAVLEDASARLTAELGSAALGDVDAALALALGEAQAAVLAFDEAIPPLRRAVERYTALGDSAGALRARGALADALAGRGLPEAIPLAREVLAATVRAAPGDAAAEARASRRVARALVAQDDPDADARAEARQRLEAAVEVLEGARDVPPAELAATWVLAACLDDDLARARARCEAALGVLERTPGEAARTLECLEALSELLVRADRLDEADRLFERAVLLAQQTFGDARTVGLLRARSVIAHRRRDLETAERFTRTALATELARWTTARADRAAEARALVAAMQGPGAPPYIHAFRFLRLLRGDGDFALSSWMNSIAAALSDAGRAAEAEALLGESLEIHCRLYGDECPNRMRTHLQLARIYADSRRLAEARAALAAIQAAAARLGQPQHPIAVEARVLSAELARGADAARPGRDG